MRRKDHISGVSLVLFLLLAFAGECLAAKDAAVRGTLIVAVPIDQGIVVCADKRLYNNEARTYTDDNVKIRQISGNALFVATSTIGFYDTRTHSMAFNAFDVTASYAAANNIDKGKVFWDGLKAEITAKLREYFASRPFAEWPASDRADHNLLFNLIFYTTANGRSFSHSLRVFYEKKRTPVIYIPDPVTEQVLTPKLSGKGREVIAYLERNPSAAADPAIRRFDGSNFSAAAATPASAVDFAGKLFRLASAGVPAAQVSPTFDCAQLGYRSGFEWLQTGGGRL